MARDKTDAERIESVLYAAGVRESGSVAAAVVDALITIGPASGLPQTTDQVRAERDLLLMSQAALLASSQRLKRLSSSRFKRLKRALENK